jgi:hypothetical protein
MKYLTILLLILGNSLFSKAQSVIPEMVAGGNYALSFANLYFEINPSLGARTSSFKLGNSEILYVDFNMTNNAGSTFWPSPQNGWGWPPPVNLDSKPYTTTVVGNKITFKGATDSKTQLRFYKTMYASTADSSVTIEYTIKNEKSTEQTWAPWEITRVLAEGLTVFYRGSGSVTGNMKTRTSETNGYVWYNQNTANSPGDKFFCDGKGWIAHVTNDNILFVKKFEDIPALNAAPTEAEIEVYTAPDDSYTEIENQGAYVPINGKDSISWKVKWYARKLPLSVDVSVGSKSLTDYIEKILVLDVSTAINKMGSSGNVRVYPNPASDKLQIDSGFERSKSIFLNIYDMQGQLVLNEFINKGKNSIDISRLEQGSYIYSVANGLLDIATGQVSIVR